MAENKTFTQEEVSEIVRDRLAKEKAKMIEDTGAESVITICPFCQYNIQDGLDAIDREDIKAMNIIELLQLAYQKD